MLASTDRCACFVVGLMLAACGPKTTASAPSAPSASAQPAPPAPPAAVDPLLTAVPAPAPEPAPEPKPEPTDEAAFAKALAPLRPGTALSTVQALEKAPGDAQAYAKAALAYAETDAPGMTLIWALHYQAMGGGPEDAKVSAALGKVLRERILVKSQQGSEEVMFNVRLAPGQMPVKVLADGAMQAPLAHVFEALFGTMLTGFRPPWTVEAFHDVLSSWAGVISTRGTALDELLVIDGWLVETAKAGHLEAFCYQLLGAAFPAELKAYKAASAAELKAYKDYLKTNAFKPRRAVLPDDLVSVKK